MRRPFRAWTAEPIAPGTIGTPGTIGAAFGAAFGAALSGLDLTAARPMLPILAACIASELLLGSAERRLGGIGCLLLGISAGAFWASDGESVATVMTLAGVELASLELIAWQWSRRDATIERRVRRRGPVAVLAMSALCLMAFF